MSRDLLLTAISMLIWGIGESMFLIFQSIYLQQWGASPLLIGTIFGGLGIMMAVVQAPAGHLADRYDPRPLMWASWFLGLISTLLMALAGSMTVFVIGMAVYSLTSFVAAPMNSYITRVRGKWSIQRSLTFVQGMFQLGSVIGPIFGGVLAQTAGLSVIYRIAAGIFVVSSTIILFIRPLSPEPHNEQEGGQSLAQNRRYLVLLPLTLLLMFATYLPQPLTPNYLQNERNLSLSEIGQLSSIGSLGNAVVMLGLGSLGASAGMLAGQCMMALFALFLWQGTGFPWYCLAYFFLGGYRLIRTMVMAFARPLVQKGQAGLAYGLLETAAASAVILAPLAAGSLYTQSPRLVFIVSLVMIVFCLIVSLLLLPRLKANPQAVSVDWAANPDSK